MGFRNCGGEIFQATDDALTGIFILHMAETNFRENNDKICVEKWIHFVSYELIRFYCDNLYKWSLVIFFYLELSQSTVPH